MQQRAQIGVGLGFGRIRPEPEGQVGAGLRRGAMQQEIGEQCLQARRVERRDGRDI
jgi:hypothetical protein